MAEIVSFWDPDPEKFRQSLRQILWEKFTSLDRFTKLFIITGFLLIVSTPFIVRMVFTTSQQASGSNLKYVEVMPSSIQTDDLTKEISFSAQAYDASHKPILDKVTYEWTTSFDYSTGFFSKIVGKENTFKPLKEGMGEIIVTARLGNAFISKTVPIKLQSIR